MVTDGKVLVFAKRIKQVQCHDDILRCRKICHQKLAFNRIIPWCDKGTKDKKACKHRSDRQSLYHKLSYIFK